MPDGGYVWWYLDGISADGRYGVTLIAFVGSVFSPYYAAARRKGAGAAPAERHVAINLALYSLDGRGPGRWCMTERGAGAHRRRADFFQVGPSGLRWDGRTVVAEIEEWAVPLPRRVRGRITLTPKAINAEAFALDPGGRHHWRPIGPIADIALDFSAPQLSWRGEGYLDSNWGTEPLERRFLRWDWSRAALPDGAGAAILYDPTLADGAGEPLALHIDAAGRISRRPAPPRRALGKCFWGVERETLADEGAAPRLLKTLEDSPFYTRSLIETRLFGQDLTAMHESLDLTRFDKRWVQTLLPFRMPRRA
ncbi:MAG: carotenoid 1,2-hydratase [Marivibrio sp.]|uniref:carotenoid 1,2-hydratase n=1 Tax=Marivibrio sp. TaxID=2039719 RepID=UPI0032ED7C14